MIESLNAIRSLGLAPVFESLYLGEEAPADLAIYMGYPKLFHSTALSQGGALTAGGLIPIVADGSGDGICLFDPQRSVFVVKSIEEPDRIGREFASWQQYLAYALLGIADSGLGDEDMLELAKVTGFRHTAELLALLRDMESLPDGTIEERCERFITQCAP